MERPLEDRDRDLLRFNYDNLHKSIWENHKVSWIVTSIFVPIIFAMQGYFIKDYFSTLNTLPSKTLIVQLLMGAFVIIFLTFVWWLIMKIFAKFNEVRINRLRKIEDIFFNNKIDIDTYTVRQYKYSYTSYLFDGKKKSPYSFSWDEIPGNDNRKLIKFLKAKFCINWAVAENIEKIDDGKTIKLTDGHNFVLLKLNNKKTAVKLEINDGRTDKIIAKRENCNLNIYPDKKHSGYKLTFSRVCNLVLIGTVAINVILIIYIFYF